MSGAMNVKLIAIFIDFLLHFCALVLFAHKFCVVFSDQRHELLSENIESADQIPTMRFQTFSFGAVLRSKIHYGSSGMQEEPAGPSGLDGS